MSVPAIDPARVVAVANHLVRVGLRSYSLDEIDGAFYWSVVRGAEIDQLFGIPVEKARRWNNREIVEYLLAEPIDEELFPTEQIIQAMQQSFEKADWEGWLAEHHPIAWDAGRRSRQYVTVAKDPGLTSMYSIVEREYPGFRRWLSRSERVTMRSPRTEIFDDLYERPLRTIAAIQISNSRSTGEDIAELIYRAFGPDQYPGLWQAPTLPSSVVTSFLQAHLVEPGDFGLFSGIPSPIEVLSAHGLSRSPESFYRIELLVEFPLPAKAVIAAYYNFEIRRHRGWHTHLHDSKSKQRPEIAVRTWVTGLLNAAGEPQDAAFLRASQLLGLQPVAIQKYTEDRNLLLRRMGIEALHKLLKPREPKRLSTAR